MRSKNKFWAQFAHLWRISGIVWQIALPAELLIQATPHDKYLRQFVTSMKPSTLYMYLLSYFSERHEDRFAQLAKQTTKSTSQLQTLEEINDLLLEREHRARELHDTIAQQVFAISMRVATALALLEQPCAARQHLEEATELTYSIQQHLLETNREFSPLPLQKEPYADF